MIQFGSKIVIVNDTLTGSMGEKVLWNFLLEGIPGVAGVDKHVTSNYTEYITKHYSNAKIIIQNATYLGLIDKNKYTIAFLQDNLRAMGRPSPLQEEVLKSSQLIVSNSKLTAKSYPEYPIKIIPIGVDDKLFFPKKVTDKKRPVGIFIGALDEVKGWTEVRTIIEKRNDINWIIVSKDSKKYNRKNVSMYNRIDQKLLAKLINSSCFFIVGSPVETECLSAVESCMCNVPIVMHNTGIFADFTKEDKEKVGYIGLDLYSGINKVLHGEYKPRRIVLQHELNIKGMITKWKALLHGREVL